MPDHDEIPYDDNDPIDDGGDDDDYVAVVADEHYCDDFVIVGHVVADGVDVDGDAAADDGDACDGVRHRRRRRPNVHLQSMDYDCCRHVSFDVANVWIPI